MSDLGLNQELELDTRIGASLTIVNNNVDTIGVESSFVLLCCWGPNLEPHIACPHETSSVLPSCTQTADTMWRDTVTLAYK